MLECVKMMSLCVHVVDIWHEEVVGCVKYILYAEWWNEDIGGMYL